MRYANTLDMKRSLVLIAVATIVLLGSYVGFFGLGKNQINTPKQEVSYSISKNTLSVGVDGKNVQSLSIDKAVITELNLLNAAAANAKAFITNQDINFDGYPDVALLTGIGYSGVNFVYDYYIYNPKEKRLEKNQTLSGIYNPTIDVEKRTITSSGKDGSEWVVVSYKFNGKGFTKVM